MSKKSNLRNKFSTCKISLQICNGTELSNPEICYLVDFKRDYIIYLTLNFEFKILFQMQVKVKFLGGDFLITDTKCLNDKNQIYYDKILLQTYQQDELSYPILCYLISIEHGVLTYFTPDLKIVRLFNIPCKIDFLGESICKKDFI